MFSYREQLVGVLQIKDVNGLTLDRGNLRYVNSITYPVARVPAPPAIPATQQDGEMARRQRRASVR